MSNILKGRKVIVQVTDKVFLDAFTCDEKTVVWGLSWVECFGINKKQLSEKKGKYHLTKLSNSYASKEKANPNVRVKGIDKPYKTITRLEFSEVLASLVALGHMEVLPVLTALATEALEVRAKEQLEIDADSLAEKERKTKEIERKVGIALRKDLTKEMKAWGVRNEEKPNYGGVTSNTYRALFGMTKKELCLSKGVKYHDDITPRDFMETMEIVRLYRFEDFVARVISKEDINPLKAVKKAKEFYCN